MMLSKLEEVYGDILNEFPDVGDYDDIDVLDACQYLCEEIIDQYKILSKQIELRIVKLNK